MENLKISLVSLITLLVLPAGFLSCDSDSPLGLDQTNETVNASLTFILPNEKNSLAKSSGNGIFPDSMNLMVSGKEMSPQIFSFQSFETTLDLSIAGSGTKLFRVEFFDSTGLMLYDGEIQSELSREKVNDISIECKARFAAIHSRFFIPATGYPGIESGEICIQNNSYNKCSNLEKAGDFGEFFLSPLPVGKGYNLSFNLKNKTGDILLSGEKEIELKPGVASNIDLAAKSINPKVSLLTKLPEAPNNSLTIEFPSGKKKPENFGDIIISELFPAPSAQDSSSRGEWLELFNTTGDSIVLKDCNLKRDGGLSANKVIHFDSNAIIPPGTGQIWGAEAVSMADYSFGSFGMVNSNSQLILSCEDDTIMLDTLHYSSETQSTAVPIKYGKVTSLNPLLVSKRNLAESWCIEDQENEFIPTPGKLWGSCDT